MWFLLVVGVLLIALVVLSEFWPAPRAPRSLRILEVGGRRRCQMGSQINTAQQVVLRVEGLDALGRVVPLEGAAWSTDQPLIVGLAIGNDPFVVTIQGLAPGTALVTATAGVLSVSWQVDVSVAGVVSLRIVEVSIGPRQ